MKTLLDDLDLISDQASTRHLSASLVFMNQSRQAMTGHLAFSRAGAADLSSDLTALAWTYIENEEDRVGDTLDQLSKDAHRRAKEHLGVTDAEDDEMTLSELLSSSEETSENYLTSEIIAQVNRDVNQVVRDYRNAALRTLMITDIGTMSREDANMQVMIDELNTKRKLWFRDRAGRKLPSQKHIRRLWRQTLRDHWMQVYLQTLAMFGQSVAVIWHPDPGYHAFGTVIEISEQEYGLDDIDKVFHPNSRALPVASAYMESIL